MDNNLIFEKVGDVNYKYPYLCVYFTGSSDAFMDIGINDDGEIEFTIYSANCNFVIDKNKWDLISATAVKFKSETMHILK